ncbi:MAG: CDP-glycerol glycerophosphotransferase family protein, partial [Candidatus Gracilibacteria bacterium]|nr:CDP-glycerol glycerophosphotransferase family protein [Candidatus Gracilibacteria bacterium]
MSNVIGLIETIFLFIFSYIVPKNKNLIIFGSMKGIHISGNPKIFYLYLNSISKGKLNLYFFDGYKTNIDNRIKVYGFGFKKYWLILRAKYLIIDACSFDLGVKGVIFGHFNLIQMWHGEPIKKIGFLSDLYIKRRNKIILFFEKLEYKTYKMILSNPGTSKIIEGAFQSKKVFNIGF